MDESFQNVLDFGRSRDGVFVPPLSVFGRLFNEALDPWAQKVYLGEISVDEAVDGMLEDGNAVIREGA